MTTPSPLTVPVLVVGAGARTTIGMTAPATAAAARAGLVGFSDHPFMVDTAGKRMAVARVPFLNVDLMGSERLSAIAGPAAAEASTPLASSTTSMPTVDIFLGLPPARPGRPSDLAAVADRVWDDVAACGVRPRKGNVLECGHAAGSMAVQAAWEAVRCGSIEFALAGGVDTYLEPETLEWLEENQQLHSAGTENNAYGFIPGEASGFVLFASGETAKRLRLPSALELAICATAQETKLINTDNVCLGDGLTTLFRALSGEPPVRRADYLYCDMNGEPYRADEFGFATIRAGGLFKDPSAFAAPADCWGDVGAASGPLFLILADAAVRNGYASGEVFAAFTSSESGERCGFITRRWIAQGMR